MADNQNPIVSGPGKAAFDVLDAMSVQELVALIEQAESKRAEKMEQARRGLLDEFRKRAAELGLSLDALLPSASSAKAEKRSTGDKLPVKFRSPNGEAWTGRGRLPGWLKGLESTGKKRDDYRV
jgi:DNA-binding protein H-NS